MILTFRPIIEASRNDDNAVFVKPAHHQKRWGEAVMRVRSNRTKLRADVIARADPVYEESAKMKLA